MATAAKRLYGLAWLSARIKRLTPIHWILVYALILCAWLTLFALSLPGPPLSGLAIYGWSVLLDHCSIDAESLGTSQLVLMWTIMSVAMMLPGFVPVLATYADLAKTGAGDGIGLFVLILGFLIVWLTFSLVAACGQLVLMALLPGVREIEPLSLPSAFLLGMAGFYQFSPLKASCLLACRNPLAIFLSYLEAGYLSVFRIGIRFGVICVGCCWALMALAFIGGAMSVAWMGLATILMATEKLAFLGRLVTVPLGILLIAASIAIVFTA